MRASTRSRNRVRGRQILRGFDGWSRPEDWGSLGQSAGDHLSGPSPGALGGSRTPLRPPGLPRHSLGLGKAVSGRWRGP
jgi:hypothetical protein